MKKMIFLVMGTLIALALTQCCKDSDDPTPDKPNKPSDVAVINQEEAKKGYITMVTVRNDGKILLEIKADQTDQTGVWIDLNNDGIRQENESVKTFGLEEEYSIGDNKIITIYGKATSLKCRENELTHLDVSNNTNLTSLVCFRNQLTQLDVSKNTSLTNLNCMHNQLTQLNVSNNTRLTGLHCSGNQLTSLDVSQNVNLELLFCQKNRIQGGNMGAFLNSLPVIEKAFGATLYVYSEYTTDIYDKTIEQNTQPEKEHTDKAKEKGWRVYFTDSKGYPQLQ